VNRKQADEIVWYIGKLWDGWNPPVELAQVMSDVFAVDWLTVEQGRDIAKSVRLASQYARPTVADFVKAIAVLKRERFTAIAEAKRVQQSAPVAGALTLSEWKRYYLTDPAGRAEWDVLPGNIRRGLRIVFKLEEAK
jgi:hypothetical protein